MNYNDNAFYNTVPGNSNRRLTRRPMETPGLEVNSNVQSQQPSQYNYTQQSVYSQMDTTQPSQQFYYNDFTSIQQPQQEYGHSDYGYSRSMPMDNTSQPSYVTGQSTSSQQMQSTIFNPVLVDAFGSNPLLAGATVRYGQKILGEVVDENIGKYTTGIAAQIKLYFSVDTRCVFKKLGLLLFPFAHTDWSITLESKGEYEVRVKPKSHINAPDLYIPLVTFVTYLLLLGLIHGNNGKFSPEMLSVQSSRVLAWEFIVVGMEILALYVSNIQSSLRILDLTAYSGYKYFGIVVCIPLGLIFGKSVFYIILTYNVVAFIYFLLFSMRWQLNSVVSSVNQPIVEYKRKRTLYFLILAVTIQIVTIWYLVSNFALTM